MSSKIKISVVIPTYNRASTIESCLKSVLDQTFKAFEIIVVDDCSTDNTVELIKGVNDKRIILYENSINKNANFCRNFGIHRAKGEYIQFLDSDDILVKDKFQKQVLVLENMPYIDMVFSLSKSLSESEGVFWNIPIYEDFMYAFLMNNVLWHTNDPIWRKSSILNTTLFWDESLICWQDWHYHIQALAKEIKIINIPETLSFFRENSQFNSISLKKEDEKRMSRINGGILVYKLLKKRDLLSKKYRQGLSYHFLLSLKDFEMNNDYSLYLKSFKFLLGGLSIKDIFIVSVLYLMILNKFLFGKILKKIYLKVINKLLSYNSRNYKDTWKVYK